jgi:tRNA(fMet)-specific endonuclease VapC
VALLDTTVLVDLTRSPRSDAHRRAAALVVAKLRAGETLYTSRINEAEFRVGAVRSSDAKAETARIERVLAGLVMLEFDAASARRFADVKAHLLQHGRPVGDVDTLIAAVALANGQPLVTRNPRHFTNVPGLTVESY